MVLVAVLGMCIRGVGAWAADTLLEAKPAVPAQILPPNLFRLQV